MDSNSLNHRRRLRAALLVLFGIVLLLPGCRKTREETSILVIIHYDPDQFDLDQFRLAGYHVSDSSLAFNEGELPPERRSSPFSSGEETALVLLSDDLVGEEITVRVWGLYQGQTVAFGRANTIPELGIMREVEVTLEVAPDCGDGEVHPTEETCDTGIDPGMAGACPADLADCEDTDVCTADRVEGAGTCLALCFNDPITQCAHGDGCCPNGCGPSDDSDCSAICGDGLVGTGETCDTGITLGEPGSCPTTCSDDGNPCTDDSLSAGGSCQAECPYNFITQFFGGDSCCPPGGDATLDSDCQPVCGNGVLEPGESCDLTIPAGDVGACPTTCGSGNPCAMGTLFDANTCGARCVVELIELFIDGDGCCPSGGNNNIDSDCAITCGNGAVESGETCDTGIPAGTPGACPTCDDNVPCTNDTVVNPGTCTDTCTHTDITTCTNGDGCCPSGCALLDDDDCSAVCGDGNFEPAEGELCDTGIAAGQPGACPILGDCNDLDICTNDSLIGAGSCQAQCLNEPVACADGDTCCSPQCNANIDDDCSPVCGNSVVEPSGGELCDTGIAPGSPGACPTTCGDGEVCTNDVLLGAGTCAAQCDFVPITVFDDADGCCPAGGNNNVDDDCPVTCGNGAVESGETCDTAIPVGDPGGCPVVADCNDGLSCTADALINPSSCTADCTNNPITVCVNGDGCCPAGCDLSTDDDCDAICGDSQVTGSESCDTAIASGSPGACPVLADCFDSDNCTTDSLVGGGTCQAHCDNDPVGCTSGDGCCPPSGCNNNTDADCPAVCGNGVLEPLDGELCDTTIAAGSPGACPTDCNDNDPCTTDTLLGTGCLAYCDHAAITTCNLSTGDSCCPAGCDATTDLDCGGCGNGLVEASYGEECDDGNTVNDDTCSNSCTGNNGSGGDTCQANNDCIGQYTCIRESDYADVVGGYCVDDAACDPLYPSLGCGPKGTCVPNIGTYVAPVCALRCTDITDCRWADGQTCVLVGAGVSACLP